MPEDVKTNTAVEVIAEIGENHAGDLERAKEMVRKAAAAGADFDAGRTTSERRPRRVADAGRGRQLQPRRRPPGGRLIERNAQRQAGESAGAHVHRPPLMEIVRGGAGLGRQHGSGGDARGPSYHCHCLSPCCRGAFGYCVRALCSSTIRATLASRAGASWTMPSLIVQRTPPTRSTCCVSGFSRTWPVP